MSVAELDGVAEALVVHPGDKLLVRVGQDTGMDGARELRDAIRERVPEVEVIVIAAEQLVVVRG